jgi:large subunit ribosomal protein L7/L12
MSESRLNLLRKKREALDAQIRAAEARARSQERKLDTRRKVLVGAAVLHHAETDPALATQLTNMLDGFLSREDERSLFELPARVKAA